MECQVEKNEHFRHLLLFSFNQGLNASKAARIICDVYGENAIGDRTARDWYAKFNNRNFDLKDSFRSGRPSLINEEEINNLLLENPRQTSRELAEQIGCTHTAILKHLHKMGKIQKLGAWIPHSLNENQKNLRVTISASLLARHISSRGFLNQFLYKIITGDEKWCLYINIKQRKEWLSPGQQASQRVKQDLHPRKTMLCVWWDWEGIIYYELLQPNQTINSQLYIQQMERLKNAIQIKRPNRNDDIILQHDNARPHIANMTREAIQRYGWEILPHPPYSPDLAPTDFHLFRSLSNAMKGILFNSDEDLNIWLNEFFNSKSIDFYKRGFEKLVERWGSVIDSNGEYIVDQ